MATPLYTQAEFNAAVAAVKALEAKNVPWYEQGAIMPLWMRSWQRRPKRARGRSSPRAKVASERVNIRQTLHFNLPVLQ